MIERFKSCAVETFVSEAVGMNNNSRDGFGCGVQPMRNSMCIVGFGGGEKMETKTLQKYLVRLLLYFRQVLPQ